MRRWIRKCIAIWLAVFLTFGNTVLAAAEETDPFITRLALCGIVNRAFEYTDFEDASFADIDTDNVKYKDMLIARKAGYLSGDNYGAANPEGRITWAQGAVIFVKLLGWNTAPYVDNTEKYGAALEWAAPYVDILQYLGIYTKQQNLTAYMTESDVYEVIGKIKNAQYLGKDNPYSVKQVSLKDNFFTYVNNPWLVNTGFGWGTTKTTSFSTVEAQVNNKIAGIIGNCVNNQNIYDRNSDEWKIGEIYKQFIDTTYRNWQGLVPLNENLGAITDAASKNELRQAIIYNAKDCGVNGLFQYEIAPGKQDNRSNSFYLNPLKLGLFDEASFYTENDEASVNARNVYKKYLAKYLMLLGKNENEAKLRAEEILTFERNIAQSRIREESIAYQEYSLDEIEKLMPNLKIGDVIHDIGFENVNRVVTRNLDSLVMTDKAFQNETLEFLKDYLTVTMVMELSSMASEELRQIYLDMYNEVLGTNVTINITTDAKAFVNALMGDALGRIYIEKYFSDIDKKDVFDLTEEIIGKYKERLKNNSWLSESAKEMALIKLSRMTIKIGYPAKWEDYSGVSIKTYNESGNIFDTYRAFFQDKLSKLTKRYKSPVEGKWVIDCYSVNAYYDLLRNEITIPAGILQGYFYDPAWTKEKKLGGIGVIVGHEISHAFDDRGAYYDNRGNYNIWWSDSDFSHFQKLAEKIASYYSKVEVMPGERVDGSQTLRENIADLGGLACAIDVLRDMDSYNAEAFFETYARAFACKEGEESIRFDLHYDEHSPGIVRVNNMVNMFDFFYNTYGIEEGDGMYIPSKDRIEIW